MGPATPLAPLVAKIDWLDTDFGIGPLVQS